MYVSCHWYLVLTWTNRVYRFWNVILRLSFILCFVCFGVFRPTIEFLTGDVTITGEMLNNTRPLSSEGSLTWNTYCDTWHSHIIVISEDRDTQTFCRASCSGAGISCFNDLGVSGLGFEHPIFRMRGDRSKWLRHRCRFFHLKKCKV